MKVFTLCCYSKDIENEIVLNLKPAESNLKGALARAALCFVGAVLFAFAAFSFGFGTGKYAELSGYFASERAATASANPAGWSLLEDNAFSIQHPTSWEAKKHSSGELPGVKIESIGGKVEIWLKIPQPYQISEEQKKKQVSSKESTASVDGRSAKVKEFVYDSGGFFVVAEVPAKDKKPEVTFWATAANEEYKKTVFDIIASFKTKHD